MARGWESKSVESQIDSASEAREKQKPRLTPEQIEIKSKRDSLLLQRTRVLQQLESCRDDRHRETLIAGLAYLESQMAALEKGEPG